MNKICQFSQTVRNALCLYIELGSDIKGRINNKSYLNSSVNSTSVALFAPMLALNGKSLSLFVGDLWIFFPFMP